jgi:hypothetical protein
MVGQTCFRVDADPLLEVPFPEVLFLYEMEKIVHLGNQGIVVPAYPLELVAGIEQFSLEVVGIVAPVHRVCNLQQSHY